MKLDNMTREERSLLLYLETRCVDYIGRVDIQRMNNIDMEIVDGWNNSGFIQFGRLAADCIGPEYTHWCALSEEAWTLAHQERKNRYIRTFAIRTWKSTEESRNIV